MKKISVVIPVYRGESFMVELTSRLITTLENVTSNFEIIYVNDQSPDNSWEAIEKLVKSEKNVIGVNLSRNFGQHAAISAGLKASSGEHVIVMDCDLQDVPEEIPKLYEKAILGNKVVVAQRINRQDSKIKKLFSFVGRSFKKSSNRVSLTKRYLIKQTTIIIKTS